MRSLNLYPRLCSWKYGIKLYTLRCFVTRRHFQSFPPYRSPSDFVREVVQVPIGSNGSVTLSILQAVQRPVQSSARPNVIVYLPSGGIFETVEPKQTQNSKDQSAVKDSDALTVYSGYDGGAGLEDLSRQQIIASNTAATVVTIHYRLGRIATSSNTTDSENGGSPVNAVAGPASPPGTFYKYPTPVHDTLAGYDWILQELQPDKIGVFGRNIGGSLALMLALTEARTVNAVQAHNPVCDWVSLDDYCTVSPETIERVSQHLLNPKRRRPMTERDEEAQLEFLSQLAQVQKNAAAKHRKGHSPPDLVPLLKAREAYFETPAKYFDAFASPLLFLRSAGKECPRQTPKYLTGPDYPVPILKAPAFSEDALDFWDVYLDNDSRTEESDELQGRSTEGEETNNGARKSSSVPRLGSRRRKALSRWPPHGLDYSATAPSWGNYGIARLDMTLPWVRISTTHEDAPEVVEQGKSSIDEIASDLANVGLDSNAALDDSGAPTESETRLDKGRRQSARRQSPRVKKETVLGSQAEEMVSTMRRACFWDREKGFGESRVQLVRLASSNSERVHEESIGGIPSSNAFTLKPAGLEVERDASDWFRKVFMDKMQE